MTKKVNLKIGLTTVPVKLKNAVSPSRGISFKTLCPECGEKMKRPFECPECGEQVSHWSKGGAGYKTSDGIIPIDRSKIKELEKESSKTIEMFGFVMNGAVDFPMKGKAYWVEPQEGGEKLYSVFAERLGNRMAIGKIVFRRKEHLIGFTSHDGRIIAKLLHYAEDIRNPPDLDLPEPSEEEREMAEELISQQTIAPDWGEYSDGFEDAVDRLVERIQAGEEIEIETVSEGGEKSGSALEQLKASVSA